MMKKFSYRIENRLTSRNEFVIDYCGEVKRKSILDVGCSYGWLEKALLAKGAKRVVGIEPEERLFYNARKEVPGARFMVGSATEIPFKSNTFDTLVYFEVLEHLPVGAEDKAISEITRVLKKGGKLIFSTPNRHLISCLLDPAWYFGHRHYCLVYLNNLFLEKNLAIDEVFLYGGIWELLRMVSHYFFKWVLGREDPFKEFFNQKIKNDGQKKDGFAYIYLKATKK